MLARHLVIGPYCGKWHLYAEVVDERASKDTAAAGAAEVAQRRTDSVVGELVVMLMSLDDEAGRTIRV